MKKTFLLFALVSMFVNLHAQFGSYHAETDFETNSGLVWFNNATGNDLWQIGPPQKTFFSQAHSTPNAILTDTIEPYPVNINSYFNITIKDVNWFTGSPSMLGFYHKFDTDSLLDGGYITVSYNGGETWLNIIHDSTMFNCSWTPGFGYYGMNFYNDDDTLFNGVNGFSGKSNGWEYSEFNWIYCIAVDEEYPDSMVIRFNFISDDIQTEKDGWMIDDIVLHSYICSGIEESGQHELSASVYPNPVTSESKIFINGPVRTMMTLQFFDITGRRICLTEFKNQSFSLKNLELSKGIYFYRIRNGNNSEIIGKFMKL